MATLHGKLASTALPSTLVIILSPCEIVTPVSDQNCHAMYILSSILTSIVVSVLHSILNFASQSRGKNLRVCDGHCPDFQILFQPVACISPSPSAALGADNWECSYVPVVSTAAFSWVMMLSSGNITFIVDGPRCPVGMGLPGLNLPRNVQRCPNVLAEYTNT